MQSRRKMKIVPLRWKLLVMTSFLMFLSWKDYFPIARGVGFTWLMLPMYLFILIVTIAFFRACTHYAFCEDCLEARFLWIPFWRIPWSKIGKATYLHVWKDVSLKYSAGFEGFVPKGVIAYEQIIYVTLKGCPPYNPKYQRRLVHNMLHPFRTACIFLPYERKYEFLDSFKECYPALEMQSLDAWKTV